MKALDIRCPGCGNPSHLTDSKALSRASVSAAFKCSNTTCRREFGGVFTLATGTPPGIESFSGSGTPRQMSRQSAAPRSNAAGAVMTDC